MADLRTTTLQYFDSINFSELNDNWIDEVISSEFTDVEENKISLSILFVNDGIKTLNKLADICYAWCENTSEEFNKQESSMSVEEDVLWTILDEVGITVRHILGFIYLLCDRAIKRGFSSEEKAFGLASAKLYFNCLRIPGSTAYSVYHSNLFCLCIDCLSIPDLISEKDNSSMRELEKHSALYTSTLSSLIPLLKEFYLGNESSTVEHVIKKLVELTGCEFHNYVNFDKNLLELGERELRRRYKISFIISSLAYQAFNSLLETDLNGDKNCNYNVVVFHLSQHILCTKAKKSSTISQKHLIVKDNAVAFICYNLKTREFNPEVVQTALKRLCRGACDKVEFRSTISEAIVKILFQMKSENIAEMIQWFLLLVDSNDAKDRTISLDILNFLLRNTCTTDSDTVSDSLKPYLTQTPIIFSILTRCDDFSPVVRKKALNILSENLECIFKFLEETKDQETFKCEELEDFNEKDLDVNGNRRFFWYNLKSFKRRLKEIANILQRRVEDYNCVTRVAALLALGNLVMFHNDFLNEDNLKVS